MHQHRNELLGEMESHFDNGDIEFFEKLLKNNDNIIRTRAVCILAQIGGRRVVEAISKTLQNDTDSLVRHEAAFALGQLCFDDAVVALSAAIDSDPSLFVRHEAAIAVGVIGSERGRGSLEKALLDVSNEVRESAKIALANLDYIENTNRTGKFSRMTGG